MQLDDGIDDVSASEAHGMECAPLVAGISNLCFALDRYFGPIDSLSFFWLYEGAADGNNCEYHRAYVGGHCFEIGVINECRTSRKK